MRGWGIYVTLGLAAALLTPTAVVGADLHLTAADRTPVRWHEWVADRGTCAVLVWASWAPEADRELIGSLASAARERELELVVVAVQESFEATSRALAGSRTMWLHDRHGSILKEYRLIEIPSLIVVDDQGQLQARLEPTAEALAGWRGSG